MSPFLLALQQPLGSRLQALSELYRILGLWWVTYAGDLIVGVHSISGWPIAFFTRQIVSLPLSAYLTAARPLVRELFSNMKACQFN